MSLLFTNIDAAVSKNNQRILKLKIANHKISENWDQLQLNSLKGLTQKCDKIALSDECLDIIQAEISDWNKNMTNYEIAKKSAIPHKLGRQLLNINDWNESLEIIAFMKRMSDKLTKPILH